MACWFLRLPDLCLMAVMSWYEEELRSKNARLVELDTLLNIDGKEQAHAEAVVAKSVRPSVLDHLKRPVPPRSTDKKPKQHEEVR